MFQVPAAALFSQLPLSLVRLFSLPEKNRLDLKIRRTDWKRIIQHIWCEKYTESNRIDHFVQRQLRLMSSLTCTQLLAAGYSQNLTVRIFTYKDMWLITELILKLLTYATLPQWGTGGERFPERVKK